MADFLSILTASEERLVALFYRVKQHPSNDFIAKINHTAHQLGVNHAQLVCALGFNKNIRDLTDILSVIGFSSYKLLTYRRDELFVTDAYKRLNIDNILDIYTARLEDAALLEELRALLRKRITSIEQTMRDSDSSSIVMSYKMEIHAIYAGGVADLPFAQMRVSLDTGAIRLMTDEIKMIVEENIIPPSNLFFLNTLLPKEKKYLIENCDITERMIRNRIQNPEISAEERDMLEDFL